ncbi:biotin/lipoyl-binding protein [Kiritimatiellaeota bacterium B1221]|nr:biotin/lipoyl-binding protein [Kiritimatiellaeota bacterium B1221]
MKNPGKFSETFWAILFGFGLLSACGQPKEYRDSDWIPVQIESSATTLQEIGILEARELASIQNLVDGTISEILEDGSRVKKGDRVMRLDDEELRNDLDSQLQNLAQLKEDLDNELAEYAVLTNSFEMTSRLKKAELAHHQLELKMGVVPLTPEELRLREIEIELAALDLEDKTSQYTREQKLVQKGFAPASSLDKARRELQAATTYLAEKKTQLELANSPVPEEQRLTLETAVKVAEDAVKRNQQKQDRDLKIQDLKIEGLRLKVEHAQDEIDLIEKRLNIVERVAPTNGILRLTQEWVWSVKAWMPLNTGQRIRGLNMIGTIVDPKDLSLRIITHESDYLRLRVGQSVHARLTAFPDQELKGEITSLTELGQDRNDLSPIYRQAPAIHQALFLVKVSLQDLNQDAMPGMTATAIIELEPERERMLIPSEAVAEESPGQFTVEILRGEREQSQVVIQGLFTADGRFEVTQGLEKDDKVLVRRSAK